MSSSANDPTPPPSEQDPYSILGLSEGATFDEVQTARDKSLADAGDDMMAKAKIEASYDALLMVSLKERQSGKISNAASNASRREDKIIEPEGGVAGSIITRISKFTSTAKEQSSGTFFPSIALPNEQGLTIRISLALLAILLTLISPPGGLEAICSLSTISLFISQVRRGRKPLSSVLWSVLLLLSGLILSSFAAQGLGGEFSLGHSVSAQNLEALPTVLILWIGILLLD